MANELTSSREMFSSPSPVEGLAAIVLCGGASSRMGFPKRDLWFDGQTFLQRVAQRASTVCGPLICVGAHGAADQAALAALVAHGRLPVGTVLVHDETAALGPLESIRVGLAAAEPHASHAFVTSCDVPNLQPDLIRTLASLVASHEAVMPIRGKRFYGMTAIYQTAVHRRIATMLSEPDCHGRVSDIRLIAKTRTVALDDLRVADSQLDSFTNINTADHYFDLLQRSGLECPGELAARLR